MKDLLNRLQALAFFAGAVGVAVAWLAILVYLVYIAMSA